ncbi:hypothetical protein [Natronorubrum daqingense]|uniref:Uncharacterized protein n=1 Tax=Natronorubrum daqingense TaxID=588898 RepID=A0A1P8RFB5_9EURY|nr:hypothetical protein [Natronorubrum daqingense]APX97329.1 hypothetical protein BB347_12290 [Natronorubrum daqingense]
MSERRERVGRDKRWSRQGAALEFDVNYGAVRRPTAESRGVRTGFSEGERQAIWRALSSTFEHRRELIDVSVRGLREYASEGSEDVRVFRWMRERTP